MTEKEWMEDVRKRLDEEKLFLQKNIFFDTSIKIPYSFEVLNYLDDKPEGQDIIRYETDLLVYQKIDNEKWKPRIIIEGKINSVTTYDVITYSQKVSTHKNIRQGDVSFVTYLNKLGNCAKAIIR